MLKEGIFALSLLTFTALATVLPIAPYKIGGRDPSPNHKLSGAVVNSKIYMFGGEPHSEAKPYVVDYSLENPHQANRIGFFKTNATDLSYVYDAAAGDEWVFETKTPFPWTRTQIVVVGNVIFFYDIESPSKSHRSKMYSYDTLTNEWSLKQDTPFVWRDRLTSCYSSVHNRLYFTETVTFSSPLRTIFHSYDLTKDQWDEETIIAKESCSVALLICTPESFKVYGRLYETDAITGEIKGRNGGFVTQDTPKMDLISISYDGKSAVAHNVSLIEEKDTTSVYSDGYLFTHAFDGERAQLSRLNVNTLEHEVIDAHLPYNLTSPLILPVNRDKVYLFGGSDFWYRHLLTPKERDEAGVPKVKSWNHIVTMLNV